MKVAIVEDNEIYVQKILTLSKLEFSLIDIDIFSSLKDFRKKNKTYDLLLLDIELKDGNGMVFIQKYPEKARFIIYITNHPTYMIDAFDFNVLGFVPKNKIEDILLKKIHKAQEKFQSLKVYNFDVADGNLTLKEDEIVYLKLQYRNIYLYTKDKKTYQLNNKSMNSIEKMNIPNLFRINKENIVNLRCIKFINNINHSIYLYDDSILNVSRRRWTDLKKFYLIMRNAHE